MVRVAPGVRLHYLDFGGPAGAPTILFLAGLGNTAHSFDDFAPRFTDKFHVVALTRRGFGESDHPESGYDTHAPGRGHSRSDRPRCTSAA